MELPIVDNQEVQAGDLLFRIDPRTFEADLEEGSRSFCCLKQTKDCWLSLRQVSCSSQAFRISSEAYSFSKYFHHLDF